MNTRVSALLNRTASAAYENRTVRSVDCSICRVSYEGQVRLDRLQPETRGLTIPGFLLFDRTARSSDPSNARNALLRSANAAICTCLSASVREVLRAPLRSTPVGL